MFIILGLLTGTAIANLVYEFFLGNFSHHTSTPTEDTRANTQNESINDQNWSDFCFTQESDELKKSEKVDITKEPFLVLKKFGHLREMICIFSPPGVGKTLLAVFIAREAHSKQILLIALDDTGDNQIGRYESVPNIKYITKKRFDAIKAARKKNIDEECQRQAFTDHFLEKVKPIRELNQIKNRAKKLMKEKGVAYQQKSEDLSVFEEIARCSNADIVILDSLSGLLPNHWEINRENLINITQPLKDRGQTLFILHHTNKEGKIYGPEVLSQTMDTVLELEKVEGNYRKLSIYGKSRYRQDGDAEECFVKMVPEGPQTARFEVCEDPSLENNSDHLTPFGRDIKQAMKGKKTMGFDDLCQALNRDTFNETSVKNELKKFEDKGYYTKTNGKDWSSITNHMEDDTAL